MSAPCRTCLRFRRDLRIATLALCSAAAALLAFEEGSGASRPETPAVPQTTYPLWDGQESVEHYALRAGLTPKKTLNLGGGIKMDFVLVPAGTFVMGTPAPRKPVASPVLGQAVLSAAVAIALFMLLVASFNSFRQKHRMQFTLRWLMTFVFVMGMGMWGVVDWWEVVRGEQRYKAALARWETGSTVEKPAHQVTLTRPFYLGTYEVTQEQYLHIIGELPCNLSGLDYPVEDLTWRQAREFCEQLGEYTHTALRLPTEAEWERAARAGSDTLYDAGDTEAALAETAWYFDGKQGASSLKQVGLKKPNRFGLYDMLGNAREWCQGCLGDYSSQPLTDPGTKDGECRRVMRGGSWTFSADFCRCAYRYLLPPGSRETFTDVGFRVLLEPEPPADR